MDSRANMSMLPNRSRWRDLPNESRSDRLMNKFDCTALKQWKFIGTCNSTDSERRRPGGVYKSSLI